jgi:hypothetical protein
LRECKNNGVDCVCVCVEHGTHHGLRRRRTLTWTNGHLQPVDCASWWPEGEETPRWNVKISFSHFDACHSVPVSWAIGPLWFTLVLILHAPRLAITINCETVRVVIRQEFSWRVVLMWCVSCVGRPHVRNLRKKKHTHTHTDFCARH